MRRFEWVITELNKIAFVTGSKIGFSSEQEIERKMLVERESLVLETENEIKKMYAKVGQIAVRTCNGEFENKNFKISYPMDIDFHLTRKKILKEIEAKYKIAKEEVELIMEGILSRENAQKILYTKLSPIFSYEKGKIFKSYHIVLEINFYITETIKES